MLADSPSDSTPERVAGTFLQEVGAGPRPDAFELAKLAGLQLCAAEVARASIGSDGTLTYPVAGRPATQQRAVVMTLAGMLLEREAPSPSRELVANTAAALMLPREEFERASALTDWNLRALQELYPNASMAMVAARIAMLHDAVVTWFDRDGIRWRSLAQDGLEKPTRFECYLAEIARETDTVLHPERRVWAFPLRRSLGVVLVCETKALLARKD